MTMMETGSGAPKVPPYKVISQQPRTITGPTGLPVQGWLITAQLLTPAGTTFTIQVPDSQYPQGVKALLSQKAVDVDSIDTLSA